jgi:hypothetical protein
MNSEMKIIVAFLLASCVVSFAQTNTDSSGYVTNANLLTPFTLTNSVGDVITDAVLVKLTPNKFIYKTPSGAMGMLRLDSLSKDLQEKFGFDPQAAQAADEQKKVRQQQLDQQQRETATTPQVGSSSDEVSWSKSFTVRQDDVQVSVQKVFIFPVALDMDNLNGGVWPPVTRTRDNYLNITMLVSNLSTGKKMDFTTWRNDSATLTDDNGNTYKQIKFDSLLNNHYTKAQDDVSIYPTNSFEDLLVFELPVANLKWLHLELPAENFGGSGMLRFEIPPSSIQNFWLIGGKK